MAQIAVTSESLDPQTSYCKHSIFTSGEYFEMIVFGAWLSVPLPKWSAVLKHALSMRTACTCYSELLLIKHHMHALNANPQFEWTCVLHPLKKGNSLCALCNKN